MPPGQQPTPPASNAVQAENTQGLKVYSKLEPTDTWKVDKSLVCLGHGKTKGSKIGSAQFTVLMDDNNDGSVEWNSSNLAMRFNAAVKYNIDMSTGYKTPYLVMVTDTIDGTEVAIWFGYLSTASQDFVRERASASALSYTGLLDQQQILGGWYSTIEESTESGTYKEVDYYYDWVPVYNVGGIGNKSEYFRNPEGQYKAYGVDNTKLKSSVGDGSLWNVDDMLKQIFSRCTAPLFKPETESNSNVDTINFWQWVTDLYRATLPFDLSKVSGEGKPLENSPTLNDYTLQGKTIWEAIVELVESVDGLTITEEIDATDEDPKNQRPYISVVNLKG